MKNFNHYYTIIFAVLVLFQNSVIAQNTDSLGLIFDDEEYQNTPDFFKKEGVKWDEIPNEFSLKKYTPFAGNQRKTPSCVVWSVGYGAMSIYKAKKKRITNRSTITQLAYSAPCMIQKLNRKLKKQGGLTFNDFFKALVQDRVHQICRDDNPKLAVVKGKKVFSIKDLDAIKIRNIKKALSQGHPVAVGIYKEFNFYRKNYKKSSITISNEIDKKRGHAILIIGYDEFSKTFEIMNSFGTSWGEEGFVKVKYSQLCKILRYGYVLDLK